MCTCVFVCNLPPTFLGRMTGAFLRANAVTNWNEHRTRINTDKESTLEKKILPPLQLESNPRPSDHESGTLQTELSRTPNYPPIFDPLPAPPPCQHHQDHHRHHHHHHHHHCTGWGYITLVTAEEAYVVGSYTKLEHCLVVVSLVTLSC